MGLQLALIPNARVYREFNLGRHHGKSIDFVVVLPEVTLLVEAKASRLTEPARAGLARLAEDRERTIQVGRDQIDRTARLAAQGHPDLTFIPTDRPQRGLVVTLEPYWMAYTGFGTPLSHATPTVTASIRELEQFCANAMQADPTDVLLNLPTSHSNRPLEFVGMDSVRNPILARHWHASLSEPLEVLRTAA